MKDGSVQAQPSTPQPPRWQATKRRPDLCYSMLTYQLESLSWLIHQQRKLLCWTWRRQRCWLRVAARGIGFGLAERFLLAGAQVLATGRNAEKLRAAEARLPGLMTITSDAGSATDRVALADYVKARLPGLNVVINNAGIQRRVGLAADKRAMVGQAGRDRHLAGWPYPPQPPPPAPDNERWTTESHC